jgi:hypothetical protein
VHEFARWQGTRFVLKAGKALNERAAYALARIRPNSTASPACELVFNIQGGDLGTAIAWDRCDSSGPASAVGGLTGSVVSLRAACAGMFGDVRVPAGWEMSEQGAWHVMRSVDVNPPNAYDVVVQEVLEGDRSMFLDTEVGAFPLVGIRSVAAVRVMGPGPHWQELLVQWAAWDSVLKQADRLEPHVYGLGSDFDEIKGSEPARSAREQAHDEL